MSLFKEHRLIFRKASDFGYTSTADIKKRDRAAKRAVQTSAQSSRDSQRAQKEQAGKMNNAAQSLGRDVKFTRRGVAGSRGTEIYGKTGGKAFSTGLTQNVSAEQKRNSNRMKAESDVIKRHTDAYNKRIESGNWISKNDFQYEMDQELNALRSGFQQKDAQNQAMQESRLEARSGVTKRSDITGKNLPQTTMQERAQLRGQSRSARLGLPSSVPMNSETSIPIPSSERNRRMPAGDGAPIITGEGESPSQYYDAYTQKQREASGALNGDTLDAPDSMAGIQNEELAALDPMMGALDVIRDEFKIYQKGAQSLLDQRGLDIQKYKKESIERAEAAADMKIEQSKANRDLELEVINESRDRQRRDQYLEQDKMENDYEREEDRIIGENKEKIERMKTSLGGRYGGFGSGKGLSKIETARDEASRVLRELNEDRIYARKDSVNKLMGIENDWKLERKKIFNRHDENITEAFTKMYEQAQDIDDNALDEDGDKIEKGIELLRENFDAMDAIWTKVGDELTKANQTALQRRDDLRKEEYDKTQDAFANIFKGLSYLPSNNPMFERFEEIAGLTPGTIASTKSYEERRMAISEAGLQIQQRELQLQLDKFSREGKEIDNTTSENLGYLVTATGEVLRDNYGNPISIIGSSGSITGSVDNDRLLYGEESVGMSTTVNFSGYASKIGDIVPGSPYHKGGEYDIDNVAGTPIPTMTSGTVVAVNNNPNASPYGIYVDVFDGTNVTRYAHLQSANVQTGAYVDASKGQLVGLMGNTGNVLGSNGQRPRAGDTQTGSHLHLEMRSGQNFATGKLIDPMNANMKSGQLHSGNVKWVDDMRIKMRSGIGVATGVDGRTIPGDSLNIPWSVIDQEILDVAQATFRTKGNGVDWKAVNLVYDYLIQNKMGEYTVSIGGQSDYQKQQTSSDILKTTLPERIKARIDAGEDPTDIYDAIVEAGSITIDGKKYTMDSKLAQEMFKSAGYRYDTRWFDEMVPIE